MNITVTFTGTSGTHVPEGAVLTFDDVSDWQVETPSDIETITCADYGCPGCDATHRRFTGISHLRLAASSHAGRPLWAFPAEVA